MQKWPVAVNEERIKIQPKISATVVPEGQQLQNHSKLNMNN